MDGRSHALGAILLAGEASGQTQAAIAGKKAPLTLTYVANMGVLVEAGGTKVLIDALFDKPNPAYRAPEPSVLENIIKGEPPFDGVKLVFVTHNHPDHLAPSVAVRFLEAQTEAMFIAPADAVAEMKKASTDWAKIEPRVVSLDLENGDFRRLKAAGIPITAVRTLHGGSPSPMNLMYLFEINGRRIFHEGDSPGKPEIFRGFGLESAPVDLAVVHYWFPFRADNASFFQEELRPDHIALTHLPLENESDLPGKVDLIKQYYKDIFLLLPGMPEKTFLKAPVS